MNSGPGCPWLQGPWVGEMVGAKGSLAATIEGDAIRNIRTIARVFGWPFHVVDSVAPRCAEHASHHHFLAGLPACPGRRTMQKISRMPKPEWAGGD